MKKTVLKLPEGMSFKDLAAEMLEPGDTVTPVASDHPYNCTCTTCLDWWASVGPDGDVPGDYGPFTKEQVNRRQRELGREETP